ncbi:MAG: YitT family protein [Clostridia bacterium]|nr:YitT family protein [Clostridia bacterium]
MKFKEKRKIINIKKFLINLIQTLFGTALMAIAVDLFLLPNQLSVGGFSGIGTIGYFLFNLPVGTTVLVLNIPLFILALIKNGKKFFLDSLIGTISLSVFLNLFENINIVTHSGFLACIYGGVLSGIGTSIVLNANASTGGSDLLAQIVKSYKPDVKTGSIIVLIDALVVVASTVVFGEIEIGLYSAIAIYIMGKVLDLFFEGIDFAKMMIIISPNYQEISNEINKKIRRGTTAIYGKGMYREEEKKLLLCVASRREVREIRKIVKEIDKNAFLIITNAREVYGEGFK